MMKQRSLRISTFVSLSLSLFLQSRPTNAAQLKRKRRKKKEGEKGQMVGKKRRNEQKDSETLVTNALYLSRCRIKKTLLFSDTDSLVRVISFFSSLSLSLSLSFSLFFPRCTTARSRYNRKKRNWSTQFRENITVHSDGASIDICCLVQERCLQ